MILQCFSVFLQRGVLECVPLWGNEASCWNYFLFVTLAHGGHSLCLHISLFSHHTLSVIVVNISSCEAHYSELCTVFTVAHSVLPPQMWKSVVGHNVNMKVASEGDDWETDPDFEVLYTSRSVCHCGGRCVCWCKCSSVNPSWLCVSEWRVGAGAEVGSKDRRWLGTEGAHQVRDVPPWVWIWASL